MSYPNHDLAAVRALLLESGFDVPPLVLGSWSQREVHQAYSWVLYQKHPWKHGLRQASMPWLLARFDTRDPHHRRRKKLWRSN